MTGRLKESSPGRLSLSRRTGESVVIAGGLITVTVTRATDGRAELSIVAPKEITVDRGEIHLKR